MSFQLRKPPFQILDEFHPRLLILPKHPRFLILQDILSVHPHSQHVLGVAVKPQSLSHLHHVLLGERVGQQLQHVLSSALVLHMLLLLLVRHIVAKVMTLAPQVIVETPFGKLLYLLRPLHTMGDIQHHRLEIGNRDGTIRQVLKHLIASEVALTLTSFQHPLGHAQSLAAHHRTICPIQTVDIRLELCGILLVILSIYERLRLVGNNRGYVQT